MNEQVKDGFITGRDAMQASPPEGPLHLAVEGAAPAQPLHPQGW